MVSKNYFFFHGPDQIWPERLALHWLTILNALKRWLPKTPVMKMPWPRRSQWISRYTFSSPVNFSLLAGVHVRSRTVSLPDLLAEVHAADTVSGQSS